MVDEDRKDTGKSKPPETPPPIISQFKTRSEGRPWLMLLVYLLIALVVAAGVVLGGRWVYNSATDNEPVQETTTTSDTQPAEPAPAAEPNQSATPPQTSSPSPTPTPTPSPTPPRSGEITNSGPAETIGIFIAVTVAAAGLHYIYNLRKANQ
jgi:cell division protein FtsN